MMEKLFASAGEGCDLVLIGYENLALAVEVGFDLGFDGFTAEVIRHK